jgi:hypothetical protein
VRARDDTRARSDPAVAGLLLAAEGSADHSTARPDREGRHGPTNCNGFCTT